jgi:hypothetical protein
MNLPAAHGAQLGDLRVDGVESGVIAAAEDAAAAVSGIRHARARWAGRTLRSEIEDWLDPARPVAAAAELGHRE